MCANERSMKCRSYVLLVPPRCEQKNIVTCGLSQQRAGLFKHRPAKVFDKSTGDDEGRLTYIYN